jgi:hypothetical protein
MAKDNNYQQVSALQRAEESRWLEEVLKPIDII